MNDITNRQISLLLFGAIVGYGIIGLPKNIAEEYGTASWIGLVVGTIIALIFTYIITYLSYHSPGKTLYEYSQELVGKNITYIFSVIYIVYFFMFYTYIIRVASEVIKLTILINTPIVAISLTFYIVIYYALIKGLRGMARVCEVYGLLIITGYIIILFLLFTKGKLINIRPFFGTGEIEQYLQLPVATIVPFLGIELIALVPLKKDKNKGVFKYTLWMVAFIGLLYIILVEVCISIIGIDDITYYEDALISTIRRVDIQWLEFLSRMDGVFLSLWIMSIFCTATIFGYGAVFFTGKVFKDIKYNILVLIITILSLILSQIPKTIEEGQRMVDYSGYLGLVTIIVIPTILFIRMKVKRYDKKKS